MEEKVLLAVLGVFTGFVTTYLTAIVKVRKDLESEFDREIRKERIEQYPKLFCLLKLLPRFDRPDPLTPSRLHNLSVDMRDWFFDGRSSGVG
jgi:hypothetical protein